MNHSIRNLLVTGATSALARSLIHRAGEESYFRILAVSRSSTEVIAHPGLVEFRRETNIDMANAADITLLSTYIEEFFSERFDVVHFSGDFWRHKPLICTDFLEISSMIFSHYLTLCGVAQAATPSMVKHGGGRLVAFSCNSVGYNYPDMAPFTAAKAAVESFIKCFANEYACYGVSASALALPTMNTEAIVQEKPLGDHANYLQPRDLADFIVSNVLQQPPISTGNIIKVIKHSPSFYGKSFFERNPRKDEHRNIMLRANSGDCLVEQNEAQ
jgi:NAD(P)-dependent dehydrogenase (short-subunit alcohol dehydrogenase family)